MDPLCIHRPDPNPPSLQHAASHFHNREVRTPQFRAKRSQFGNIEFMRAEKMEIFGQWSDNDSQKRARGHWARSADTHITEVGKEWRELSQADRIRSLFAGGSEIFSDHVAIGIRNLTRSELFERGSDICRPCLGLPKGSGGGGRRGL